MRARICAAFDAVFGPFWVGLMLAMYRLKDRQFRTLRARGAHRFVDATGP
jgi:hypothetical protein